MPIGISKTSAVDMVPTALKSGTTIEWAKEEKAVPIRVDGRGRRGMGWSSRVRSVEMYDENGRERGRTE